jgi:hypothetical protein
VSYTTLDKVAALFPTFKRGIAQQNPSDTYIQNYIDDVAGEIDAALQRRFGEAISNTSFSTWVSQLSNDAQNLLEKINRYGAAAQLAAVFESLGFTSLGKLAKEYAEDYGTLLLELNGWDSKGEPKPQGGIYDHLFDPEARTETPRPVLGGVAGGDQPDDITPADMGQSNVFGKFDKRGT